MRSVQRILAIFESFTPDADSLTLQEIAKRIDLPKSTTFRLVQSLEEAGYLVRLDNQQYCLSFRFTRLAGLVKSTLGIREIARPIVVDLAARTRETVSLQAINGQTRICLDVVNADSRLRSVSQAGEQVALLSGASSKVLMAYMSKETLAPVLTKAARSTRRGKAELTQELQRIREQGYAVSHGERVLGVSAVAAPIRDVGDQVRYCVSVAGPTVRIQSHEPELVRFALDAGHSISLLYGARIQA
jgi:DNA-binding IclR family transcriptional regulator